MFLVVLILWNSPPDLKDLVFGFSVQFLVILVSCLDILYTPNLLLSFQKIGRLRV